MWAFENRYLETKLMKISDHCYGITGLSAESPWVVNSGFVIGGHSTLIVDTGSNYLSAQTIFGYSNSVNQENTMMVVNTEPHFDHMGGNSFFSDQGIDIFAHPGIHRTKDVFNQNWEDFNSTIQNTKRRAAREAEAFFYKTQLSNPNKQLSEGDVIDLGKVQVKVLETPGHTPYNISLFVEPDGVLYCGDCIVTNYIPNLEAGDRNDWLTWITSLERIKALDFSAIVPGHGDILIGRGSVDKELNTIKQILEQAVMASKAPTL